MFTALFHSQPQVLTAASTAFFRFGQVVNDSLPCQMPRQRLPAAPFSVWHFVPFLAGSGCAVEIVVLAASRFLIRTPCLPGRLEQASCSFDNCSLLRFRCASNNSRSRL